MKTRIITSFIATALFTVNSYSQDGASIFKKNCGVCHTIGHGKIVGPDLKGADIKHDIKWMTEWIKSSQTMINVKKDPTAVQLFNDNNKMIMTDQPLSDEEIKTVVAYIGTETASLQTPAVAESKAPSASSVAVQGISQTNVESTPGIPSKTIIYILIGIIVFLTAVLIGLSRIIKEIANTSKNRV